MKKISLKRIAFIIYAVVIIAMAFLFFTNDFGLVDIRKTAVIIGAGIDLTDDGVSVTAQVAIPQPSENGESTQYIEVEGEGVTVADALNEINKKTGFYPKLVFCKLLILGESCSDGNIFEILDYFYRDDYTQLTPVIAMCKGSAGQLLASKMRFGNTATVSIERLLSDEAKKSGNVSTVNLKVIGIHDHSPSNACYMPYIRSQSQSAEDGTSSGGQSGGSSSGSGSSEDSGGSSGGQSSGGSSSGQGSGGSQSGSDSRGGGDSPQEFLCDRTAIFRDGMFAGVLTEEQTFALNLIKNNVRHIFVPCQADGNTYTLGMRNCRGSVSVRVENGVPKVRISFDAVVQISDVDRAEDAESASEGVVPDAVLAGGVEAIKNDFSDLISALRAADCDVLELKTLLYRFNYSSYEQFADSILSDAEVSFDINLRSAG